ncbi:hypothetical protein TRICI_004782 [Trichomonascus ciferrii]|uniref:tRNA ligase kinase domain-containing protein n=1 Tax=Trichomonascus ciferrii TaxID=44093 RepID=A0A642V4G0_9ASCO|nr:hypothetical protein TRICI_004782 [Trichomonascus ciferrii]
MAEAVNVENEREGGGGKYVITAVSVVGCGKTTLFVALNQLFNWGHIQNDDMKKPKPANLIEGAIRLLGSEDVVMVDRNNHMNRERAQLLEGMSVYNGDLRYICFNFWPKSTTSKELLRIVHPRVLERTRGNRHPTIKGTTSPAQLSAIIGGFIKRFQPVNTKRNPDKLFDLVIDLDVAMQTADKLHLVLTSMHEKYPSLVPNIPSTERIQNAVSFATNMTS